MAVTLSENEKKALNELFTSIQNKKNFFDKVRNSRKNIKKILKIFLKLNKVSTN